MPKSATDIRHFVIAGVLIAIGTGVMYWLLDTVLALPIAASTQAIVIDRVVNLHLLVISFLFSLVVVFMLYSVVAFRRRSGDEGDGQHFEGNTILEIVWTVVPLILVVIFGYIGIMSLNEVTKAADNEVMVNVTGFQWAWSFEYANGVTSAELVLPVNRPMQMEMQARQQEMAMEAQRQQAEDARQAQINQMEMVFKEKEHQMKMDELVRKTQIELLKHQIEMEKLQAGVAIEGQKLQIQSQNMQMKAAYDAESHERKAEYDDRAAERQAQSDERKAAMAEQAMKQKANMAGESSGK